MSTSIAGALRTFVMAALFVVPGTALAQQRTLSVATLAPAGSTWMRVLDSANRELRRRTTQGLALQFYPGGVQGDESEVIHKMSTGRLDAGVVTAIGLGHIYRPILAFALPGMFASQAAMEASRRALAPEVEQQFRNHGYELLAWGESASPRMFSATAVHGPDDLRTVHPWIWRDDIILPALYTEAHAVGVPLQLPEVLGAIQTHRVDAVVAPPLACLALQWYTGMHFVSDAANAYGLGGIVFSRRAFESLSPEYQTILREVIAQFNGLMAHNVDRDDQTSLQTMRDRGMQLVEQTPQERAQWVSLFDRTRARLTGSRADQVAEAPWMERVRTGH